MPVGDFLTRLTVWLALAAYAIGTACIVRSSFTRARWIWTLGCAFYLAHVLCAFGFFHNWSHTAAYVETAHQTRELVGWNWGAGIFVNYLFTLVWLADVLWWWLAPATSEFGVPASAGQASLAPGARVRERTPDRLKAGLRTQRRSPAASAMLHGFFFFMVFNGAVVFGHGPVRWYGVAICAAVAYLWARKFHERRALK
jgi:hypothetical protein